jgi:hypothetical protein
VADDFTYGWRPHHTLASGIKMRMQKEATKLLCGNFMTKKSLNRFIWIIIIGSTDLHIIIYCRQLSRPKSFTITKHSKIKVENKK